MKITSLDDKMFERRIGGIVSIKNVRHGEEGSRERIKQIILVDSSQTEWDKQNKDFSTIST